MKAKGVFLANGGTILTEAGEDCCWDSEEVYSVEVEIDYKWECDICGERYDPFCGGGCGDQDEDEDGVL